ncbi:hypothetical protein, partial [Nitrospirillum viridazoti]|uniref:hypothetical protein n=1 Tax=Nitrospirillum viridazoti TaxID=3144925 RepID=UPI0019D6DE89
MFYGATAEEGPGSATAWPSLVPSIAPFFDAAPVLEEFSSMYVKMLRAALLTAAFGSLAGTALAADTP